MDITVKGINIRLVGTGIGELFHIADKSNHMIDTDKMQGNIGIHQIILINHVTLMPMMVPVEETTISIGNEITHN